MAYLGRKGAAAPINAGDIPDDSITTAKIVADAVGSSDLAPNIVLTGGSVGIPSVTTANRPGESGGTNASQTAIVGMLIYNTTLGIIQQYNASGWASIDSPPTITSFTYPEGTALDPAGSTTKTIVITGTNFQVGVTVAIDGTAPTSTTRNSATQITITGYPAKAAATYSAGLVITNPTGLAGSADIIYDAIPAWTTAAGNISNLVEGTSLSGQGAEVPRIIAAEVSDTIDYAQVSDAGGATIITTGAGGLTLGTTGVGAGYLTGTLAAGTNAQQYDFYAKAQDDEGQFSAVRLFNIKGYDSAATGGSESTYNSYTVHTFVLSSGASQTFQLNIDKTCDILIVGGGGGGGNNIVRVTSTSAGGGGAGGLVYVNQLALSSAAYTIAVGAGGDKGPAAVDNGTDNSGYNGGNSVISASGGFTTITALGGGGGSGAFPYGNGLNGKDGGSGGGSGYDAPYTSHGGSALSYSGTGTGFGYDGGDAWVSSTRYNGGGGGGAGSIGLDATAVYGGDGGNGKDYSGTFGTVGGASGVFAGGGGGGQGSAGSSSTNSGNGGGNGGYTGQGGAGRGGFYGGVATDATDNTGSGGGGGGDGNDPGTGADGGNGIIIFRYLT